MTRTDVRELVIGREVDRGRCWTAWPNATPARRWQPFARCISQGESTGALFGRDIVPHYHRLLVARELSLATAAERARVDVAALGLNPATVGRWMDQAARFDRLELERAMELLLDVDRQIKTGETEAEPSHRGDHRPAVHPPLPRRLSLPSARIAALAPERHVRVVEQPTNGASAAMRASQRVRS